MPLNFITGNKNKFLAAKEVLPELEMLDVELDEIQDLDAKKIIEHKVREAFKHHPGPFIVEDQSFSMDCLGGLPGPFIKWFLHSMGVAGIAEIARKMGNNKAKISFIYGYVKNKEDVYFFQESMEGLVVEPRGKSGFGWDCIFQPQGWVQTFAEWKEENGLVNPVRREALEKIKKFIAEN